ncbi:hypothetical protein [Vibrio splendidus]|uniref:hypothetical protein n=1 Tax=Vibrio splendidus TaxID=29497 RepID=UPI00080E1D3C|nr:hypothetical protein [Vibrio splendidus]OCH68574.1 hypothetical protein A6D94_05065 [Vibrio splendidus]
MKTKYFSALMNDDDRVLDSLAHEVSKLNPHDILEALVSSRAPEYSEFMLLNYFRDEMEEVNALIDESYEKGETKQYFEGVYAIYTSIARRLGLDCALELAQLKNCSHRADKLNSLFNGFSETPSSFELSFAGISASEICHSVNGKLYSTLWQRIESQFEKAYNYSLCTNFLTQFLDQRIVVSNSKDSVSYTYYDYGKRAAFIETPPITNLRSFSDLLHEMGHAFELINQPEWLLEREIFDHYDIPIYLSEFSSIEFQYTKLRDFLVPLDGSYRSAVYMLLLGEYVKQKEIANFLLKSWRDGSIPSDSMEKRPDIVFHPYQSTYYAYPLALKRMLTKLSYS